MSAGRETKSRAQSAAAPTTKQILILANSVKNGGRCIAGREIIAPGEEGFGEWVRPVSDCGEGELHSQHSRLRCGGQPDVLDIIDVPLAARQGNASQPENWVIAQNDTWSKAGSVDSESIVDLEEHPVDLWHEPSERIKRASHDFLMSCQDIRSLYLIRPTNLRAAVWTEFNPFQDRRQKKRVATFEYNDVTYELDIKDAVFDDKYVDRFPGLWARRREFALSCNDDCLLCVSLTDLFNGHHYKLVAAIIELN